MRKKLKPVYAYAAVMPPGRINEYWVRPLAKMVRHGHGRSWKEIRKDGIKIVRVKLVAAGVPR